MSSAIAWIVFIIPAIALMVAWKRAATQWSEEPRSVCGVACLTLASASWLLGVLALVWVHFIQPLAPFDYRVERWGLSLSLFAVVAGFAVREKSQRRYFGLGLLASGWLLVVFFMDALSY